jgi:hypothetical protein
MRKEWTSTPGASQEGINLTKALELFKDKLALEAAGQTTLAVEQGDLFKFEVE